MKYVMRRIGLLGALALGVTLNCGPSYDSRVEHELSRYNSDSTSVVSYHEGAPIVTTAPRSYLAVPFTYPDTAANTVIEVCAKRDMLCVSGTQQREGDIIR